MTNPTTLTAQPGTPFVESVREFEAAPATVYRAYTEPELLKRWLGPRELELTIESYNITRGGSYRYGNVVPQDGSEHWFNGVVHTATPGELIVKTWEYEPFPGLVSVQIDTFEDLGGNRTRVTSRTIFPTIEARDGAWEQGMSQGLDDSMERLDEVIAEL